MKNPHAVEAVNHLANVTIALMEGLQRVPDANASVCIFAEKIANECALYATEYEEGAATTVQLEDLLSYIEIFGAALQSKNETSTAHALHAVSMLIQHEVDGCVFA